MPENNLHDQVWVSELNARPEVRGAFARRQPIRFYDTTLRDGEQTVGVVLSPQQKLEIARKLDELGVSRIEAGFPRVSADDAEAIRLMSGASLKAELWGFSRAVKADLEELVRLGVHATIIEAPTSDIKLKAYAISRDEVLRRVREAIAFARQNGITVAFFAVDGTRTGLEFLKQVYLAALEAGAAELVVVDTIGACGPEAAEFLTREVCSWAGPSVPVHWHGHNDFGLGTASAIAAVRLATCLSSPWSASNATTSAPRRYASNACRPPPQPRSSKRSPGPTGNRRKSTVSRALLLSSQRRRPGCRRRVPGRPRPAHAGIRPRWRGPPRARRTAPAPAARRAR